MAEDTFEQIAERIELIDKDEFLCQNCGEFLMPQFVEYKKPFSKKELLECEKIDDYADIQLPEDHQNIIIACSCGNAKLCHADIEHLHEYCEEVIVEGEVLMHDSVRL
jgi:hypothetical protein